MWEAESSNFGVILTNPISSVICVLDYSEVGFNPRA